jgi:hypothetical protein
MRVDGSLGGGDPAQDSLPEAKSGTKLEMHRSLVPRPHRPGLDPLFRPTKQEELALGAASLVEAHLVAGTTSSRFKVNGAWARGPTSVIILLV